MDLSWCSARGICGPSSQEYNRVLARRPLALGLARLPCGRPRRVLQAPLVDSEKPFRRPISRLAAGRVATLGLAGPPRWNRHPETGNESTPRGRHVPDHPHLSPLPVTRFRFAAFPHRQPETSTPGVGPCPGPLPICAEFPVPRPVPVETNQSANGQGCPTTPVGRALQCRSDRCFRQLPFHGETPHDTIASATGQLRPEFENRCQNVNTADRLE